MQSQSILSIFMIFLSGVLGCLTLFFLDIVPENPIWLKNVYVGGAAIIFVLALLNTMMGADSSSSQKSSKQSDKNDQVKVEVEAGIASGGRIGELSNKLASAEKRVKQLEREYKSINQKSEARKIALEEAESRLGDVAETSDDTQRDARINAELVHLLAVFQEKGRFVDFLMEDITPFEDAQVGAVARAVHQGCSQVMQDYFDIEAVESAEEGSSITLNSDFDAHRYRLVGKVVGDPPFSGALMHKGWATKKVAVPRVADVETIQHDVIAPAEIEIAS